MLCDPHEVVGTGGSRCRLKSCPQLAFKTGKAGRRVGWGPNEFTSLGRGGACRPDDKGKELSISGQLLRQDFRRKRCATRARDNSRRREERVGCEVPRPDGAGEGLVALHVPHHDQRVTGELVTMNQ